MRSPINANVINGASVNVWVEAPALSSEAGAFGIAERHAYFDGSSTSTATIIPVVGNRTAYHFANDAVADAGIRFIPLRTAFQFGVSRSSAGLDTTVTRYAWVDFPVAYNNQAAISVDEDRILVFATAFPHPARAVSISWVSEDHKRIIKTRLRKGRSVKSAKAHTRLMANTTIGFGASYAVSDGQIDTNFVGVQQFVKSEVETSASSSLDTFHLVQGMTGTASCGVDTHLSPTTSTAGGTLRFSWFDGRAEVSATQVANNIRSAYVYREQIKGSVNSTLFSYRFRPTRGTSTTTAQSQNTRVYSWHLHRVEREKLRASSLSYLGYTKLTFRWIDEQAFINASTTGELIHYRWIGMEGAAVSDASISTINRVTAVMQADAESSANTTTTNKVLRYGAIEASSEANSTSSQIRYAYQKSKKTIADVIDNAVVVRWAGHRSQQTEVSEATAEGICLRILPIDAYVQTAKGETEAYAIKSRLMKSDVSAYANSINLIEPVRYAKVFEKPEAVSEVDDVDELLHVRTWFRMYAIPYVTAITQSDGLREFFVEPAPAFEGNATTAKMVFKINATTRAPDNRVMWLDAYNREMFVPYTNREYIVQ